MFNFKTKGHIATSACNVPCRVYGLQHQKYQCHTHICFPNRTLMYRFRQNNLLLYISYLPLPRPPLPGGTVCPPSLPFSPVSLTPPIKLPYTSLPLPLLARPPPSLQQPLPPPYPLSLPLESFPPSLPLPPSSGAGGSPSQPPLQPPHGLTPHSHLAHCKAGNSARSSHCTVRRHKRWSQHFILGGTKVSIRLLKKVVKS